MRRTIMRGSFARPRHREPLRSSMQEPLVWYRARRKAP